MFSNHGTLTLVANEGSPRSCGEAGWCYVQVAQPQPAGGKKVNRLLHLAAVPVSTRLMRARGRQLPADEQPQAVRFREGELLFVHPWRPPTRGCDVVVEIHPQCQGDPSTVLVREYVTRQDDGKNCLYHPDDTAVLSISRIKAIYRVLTVMELFCRCTASKAGSGANV